MEEDLAVHIQLGMVIFLTAGLIASLMTVTLIAFNIVYRVNDTFVNSLDAYHTYSVANACVNSVWDKASGPLAFRVCIENEQQISGITIILPVRVYESDSFDSPYTWDAEVITTDDCRWAYSSYNKGLTISQVSNKFMSDFSDKNFTLMYCTDEFNAFQVLAYQRFYQGYYRVDGSDVLQVMSEYVPEDMGSYYTNYCYMAGE